MNLLRADTKFPNTVYMEENIRTKVDNQESKYILVSLQWILFKREYL